MFVPRHKSLVVALGVLLFVVSVVGQDGSASSVAGREHSCGEDVAGLLSWALASGVIDGSQHGRLLYECYRRAVVTAHAQPSPGGRAPGGLLVAVLLLMAVQRWQCCSKRSWEWSRTSRSSTCSTSLAPCW